MRAETKITRAQIEKGMACMSAFDSFFSFYRKSVKGVHGTAIFTKRDVVVPVKAEEGIGSSLLPTTMPVDERIGGYPLSSDADLDYNTMKDLDSEGRTTVIDTGMFVLINLCVCSSLSLAVRSPSSSRSSRSPCHLLAATARTRPTRTASSSSSTSTRWSTGGYEGSSAQAAKSSSSATSCVLLPPSWHSFPSNLADALVPARRTFAPPTSTRPTQSAARESPGSRPSRTTRRGPGSTASPARTAS